MATRLTDWLRDVDDLLRGDRTHPQTLADRGLEIRTGRLAVVIIVLCMIYGACMGSYALLKEVPPELDNSRDRYMQIVASAVKTPALFLLTLIVTLPSLYVFNALVGSRLTFRPLVRLLAASLAVNAAVLASLGPIVAFFSVSTTSHAFMVLLNVAMFTVAGVLGLLFLLQTLHRLTRFQSRRAHVAPTPAEADADPPADAALTDQCADEPLPEPSALDMPRGQALAEQTRTVFRCWVVLFAVVGAQMGWVLRPFIGSPNLPFTWFRERKSNFFAAVLQALGDLFSTGG